MRDFYAPLMVVAVCAVVGGCVARWNIGTGSLDVRKPDGVPILQLPGDRAPDSSQNGGG